MTPSRSQACILFSFFSLLIVSVPFLHVVLSCCHSDLSSNSTWASQEVVTRLQTDQSGPAGLILVWRLKGGEGRVSDYQSIASKESGISDM